MPRGIGDRPLLDQWRRAAAARPEHVAVVDREGDGGRVRRVTHAELDALVARWAARLSYEGIRPATPVGLCAGSEIECVVGFLAILDAGGVVVPLDPAVAGSRLRGMAEGAGCAAVVVSRTTRGAVPGIAQLDVSGDPGEHDRVAPPADPDRGAVIYHTSGSTGRPKPVLLTHRAISSRVLSMCDWFGITADDVVGAGSAPSFDPFLQQMWFPLCAGGTVWLPVRTSLLEPTQFWREAEEMGLSHLNLVPSQVEVLLRRPPERPVRSLRRIVLGGERMPQDLPARIAAALGPVAIFNMYGPTEATVDATGHRADPSVTDRDIPIGRVLPGCRVRILDERLARVAVGEVGEVCIGGAGLAVGYPGLDEATAAAFVPDPFGAPGDRLYRTGDFGFWLPDGEVAFVGRRDDQVKIRGQRIELGEVEQVCREHPGVTAAAVTKWDAAPGGAVLIAHIVGQADPADLRAWLSARLPAAAVPLHITRMPALPRLPSGKIDRASLPRPTVAAPPPVAAAVGRYSLEQAIASAWAVVLGRSSVDVSANLFEMGAHSLLVPAAQAQIELATGHTVSAVDLFRFPTVAALARHLAGESSHAHASGPRGDRSAEIAVVGMAFRFPGASDAETYWNNLVAGTDSIRRADRAALARAGAAPALVGHPDFVAAHGAIDDADRFDPLPFGYSQGEAAGIDPQQRLLLQLAWLALENASCDPEADGPVGVFAGVGFNAYLVDNLRDRLGIAGSTDRFAAVVGVDKDFAATRIAYKLGLTGPAMTVNSACSTSLSVTVTAVDSLRAGRCRVALAGAASLGMFSPLGHVYAEGGIASRSGVCRPFDAEADGVVAGAGAAVLVLKRLEDALADGDRIHAVIRGIGVSNDGSRKAAFSAPTVDGQLASIAGALADAGVSAADIGFVEGHGTGTALGDPIEVTALNLAYRGVGPGTVLLGSVKGNLGHLDAAAGMAGLVKAVLAVGRGLVPPTAHYATPNPRIPFGDSPFRVNAAAEPWPGGPGRPRLAGVSAFGMGGTNVHVIVGQAPETPREPRGDGPVLLTLSAASATCRTRLADVLAAAVADPLADTASSVARRRPQRFRRAVVARSAAAARTALVAATALDGEAPPDTATTALLFPGQGAQRPGMAAALYEAIPAVRDVVDEAHRVLAGSPISGLRDLLLVRSADPAAAAAISETQWTQPALFVTEYATAKALEAFGILPSALIGHSIGEYVAACLAGVMSFEDALRLVAARGRLMASAPRGEMLAVSMPEADVRPMLAQSGADLATVNGARQCVAAGTPAQIAALAKAVAAAGKPSRRLVVSHAFHSSLMEPILDAFGAEVARTALSVPAIPIVSNLSGQWLTDVEATDPGYWVRHLRGTVRFADGLRCLLGGSTRYLVEAGPGATLTRLARGAGVSDARAVATQPAEDPDGYAEFLGALARLWVTGAPVDRLRAAGDSDRRVPMPGYPFDTIRLWIEPGASVRAEAPAGSAAPASSDARAAGDTASVVADVWRDVLGVPQVGPDDDYLALGGDSLIAVRIAAKLRERLGCDLSPSAIFREGTVVRLARVIDAARPEAGGSAAAPASTSREEGWL